MARDPYANKYIEKKIKDDLVIIITNPLTALSEILLPNGSTVGKGTFISSGVKIYPNVKIGGMCTIYKNVTIKFGTIIEYGVRLSTEVYIGGFARICAHAYIGRGATIGPETYIGEWVNIASIDKHDKTSDNVVIGGMVRVLDRTTIGSGASIGDYVHIPQDVSIGNGTVIKDNVYIYNDDTDTDPIIHADTHIHNVSRFKIPVDNEYDCFVKLKQLVVGFKTPNGLRYIKRRAWLAKIYAKLMLYLKPDILFKFFH